MDKTKNVSPESAVVLEKVCGLDVHKKTCTATIVSDDKPPIVMEDLENNGPGMNHLYQKLGEEGCDTVVMESTGPYWMGAYDYLEKPFAAEKLLTAVQNALDRRRLEGQGKKNLEKLGETEEKYHQLFDSVTDAIMIFDNAVCTGQSQPCSPILFLGGKKWIKNPLRNLLIHPNARIGY